MAELSVSIDESGDFGAYDHHSPFYGYVKQIYPTLLTKSLLSDIITVTEPDTPLNDADHVGSFNFRRKAECV